MMGFSSYNFGPLLFLITTLILFYTAHAFVVSPKTTTTTTTRRFGGSSSSARLALSLTEQKRQQLCSKVCLSATSDSDDESDEEKVNPYQDENYPDLEFIDYSDPNYQAYQDDDDIASSSEEDVTTLQEIENMREDRRRRNDEYQFETYCHDVYKDGNIPFYGEWTIYRTSTFVDGMDDYDSKTGMPHMITNQAPIYVQSRAYKITVDDDDDDDDTMKKKKKKKPKYRVDSFRIVHEETMIPDSELDENQITKRNQLRENDPPEARQIEKDILEYTYYPKEQMEAYDFRGHQGNMCCGKGAGHCICKGVPLISSSNDDKTDDWIGPFSEMRTELGIMSEGVRLRIKLDYRLKEEDEKEDNPTTTSPPPLWLKTLIVCREAGGMLPTPQEFPSLFETNGAPGGLYDFPPLGPSYDQSSQYLLLDMMGSASALIPYKMDQNPDAFNGFGWVTSLDWTPGRVRYQLDRKVQSGADILGLRTLELTEVEGAKADEWRPRDGGQDMRQ